MISGDCLSSTEAFQNKKAQILSLRWGALNQASVGFEFRFTLFCLLEIKDIKTV